MEDQFKTFKNLCGICLSKAIGFRLGGFYNVIFFLVSMRAKGIVFSCYTTNSNVCPRNLKIPVRGFIHKINGNTNSNNKKLDNLKGTLSSQMRHRMDLRAIQSPYFLFIQSCFQ